MNTGAMFLVSSDVGNLLCKLDETTAHNVILRDDAFANNIKDIFELPYIENINKNIMIFRSDEAVRWFFSILRMHHIVKEEDEWMLTYIIKQIRENQCCLIYHR